ncbi:apolipoprotein N-acyltransferase [Paracoccus stylophorae]|uniref:Apolipoprotein N-acyltransferase n=1 Tax=Paracoccus stylophorae TaxID=659350 RepID=A0ABY7STB4_9RHOB|nr:apolipoprotein N-acyltransferase [Paracoccus stylophorae]WCR10121.1 apolipoprotein N-acyltransferase [Paracoccus stylophorae]
MQDRLSPPHLHPRRPPLIRLAPDLGLGLIAALGLAPAGVWGATVVALAAILWRLARARPAAVFWHGLAAGLGWFVLAMSWIVEPFLVQPDIYGWMAPFALILMALGGALFWAIPVWLAARVAPGWRSRIIAMAAALILSDWLRGWIFTGLPWARIGHVWIDTPVAQAAAWIGAVGLSLLTLTLASLPALLWRPSERTIFGFLPGAILAIVLTGGLWAAGLARLAQPLPADRDAVVRIVQPDAEQHLKWDPEWSAVFFRRLLDLSAEPGRRDLVIWPETAVNFLLNDADEVLPAMAQAAGAPLVLGIQRRQDSRFYNSLTLLSPEGRILSTYDKFHLVPFGEYMAWGDALANMGITAFAARYGHGYSAGPGPAVMSAPGLPDFQPLICYEAIFPQHLRGLDARPGWLLQATNDGWFGRLSGPYQHLAQARLRSIETGLPLIRAANTGVSAVIDARGRVRDRLALGGIGHIDAKLPGALPETVWSRAGPAPVVILALLALIAAALLPRLRTKDRPPRP